MRKVTLRLIPFLLLLYVCNLLDRNNVAFTKLAVQADVGMTGAEYGFAAGRFYFGYLVFEVPSNLITRFTPLARGPNLVLRFRCVENRQGVAIGD